MYMSSRVKRWKEVRPRARIENLVSLYSCAHVGFCKRLNIAGIPRMSSVTIFQPDHFVLSTICYSNLTFRSPLLPGSFFRKR